MILISPCWCACLLEPVLKANTPNLTMHTCTFLSHKYQKNKNVVCQFLKVILQFFFCFIHSQTCTKHMTFLVCLAVCEYTGSAWTKPIQQMKVRFMCPLWWVRENCTFAFSWFWSFLALANNEDCSSPWKLQALPWPSYYTNDQTEGQRHTSDCNVLLPYIKSSVLPIWVICLAVSLQWMIFICTTSQENLHCVFGWYIFNTAFLITLVCPRMGILINMLGDLSSQQPQ